MWAARRIRSRSRSGRTGGRLPFARELRLIVRLAGRIIRVGRAEGAKLIHAHSPSLNGLPAVWAGRRLGLPVIHNGHLDDLPEDKRAAHERAFMDADTHVDESGRIGTSSSGAPPPLPSP